MKNFGLIAVGLIVGFMVGFSVGAMVECKNQQKEAVRFGHAEYNNQTANFQWKEIVVSTNQ